MALGLDIYRYQTVTDWNAVKAHGVKWIYVKGSDGGGPAIVPADNQVRGAKSIGVPVGLYHYAQLSPSPEAQAHVLHQEVRRLDADGLPPALDIEDPHVPGPAARDFTIRFLRELRGLGYRRVTLYGNVSMFNGINADDLPLSDVVLWVASYGNNDGTRHPLPARWRGAATHQYTSVGRIPGITGNVDVNESQSTFYGSDEDMPLTQADATLVANAVWDQLRPQLDKPDTLLPMWVWAIGANMGSWAAANKPPVTVPADMADQVAAALLGPIKDTLKELDGMSEADAERFTEVLGRKLTQG